MTKYLKVKDVENATESKRFLEQRQRDEAKERKEQGKKWETKVCTYKKKDTVIVSPISIYLFNSKNSDLWDGMAVSCYMSFAK